MHPGLSKSFPILHQHNKQNHSINQPNVNQWEGYLLHMLLQLKNEVKVIWQKASHGGPIPRLGVTPGGRKLYHWIPGVGFPISVP